jgi:hypothetical protein
MPVDIIESFRLGTDLPLDSRYVVNSYNDVSLYWFPGMQVFQESNKQLYWYDGSIWNPINDSSVISYIDGSLYSRDLSLNFIFSNGLKYLQESSINFDTFFWNGDLLDISVGKYDTDKLLVGKSSTQVLNVGYADITSWDIPLVEDSPYSFNPATGVILFQNSGWYQIDVVATTNVLSGNTRAATSIQLVENTGSGYVQVPYTESFFYNRTSGVGRDSTNISTIRYYNSGHFLKLQGQELNGNNQLIQSSFRIIKSEIGKSVTGGGGSGDVTKDYVDASLAVRDVSIQSLFLQNISQDSSIEELIIKNLNQDSYILNIDSSIYQIDSQIQQLDASIVRIDSSLFIIDLSLNRIDSSISQIDDIKLNRADLTTGDLSIGGTLYAVDDSSIGINLPYAHIDTSNGNKIVSSGVYYGQSLQIAGSNSVSITNSTTPIVKVSMVTDNLPLGTYKAIVTWIWNRSSIANSAIFDVTLNGNPLGDSNPIRKEIKDNTDIVPETFIYYGQISGINTIEFRYWGETTTGTTQVSDVTIELIRIN